MRAGAPLYSWPRFFFFLFPSSPLFFMFGLASEPFCMCASRCYFSHDPCPPAQPRCHCPRQLIASFAYAGMGREGDASALLFFFLLTFFPPLLPLSPLHLITAYTSLCIHIPSKSRTVTRRVLCHRGSGSAAPLRAFEARGCLPGETLSQHPRDELRPTSGVYS